MSDKFFEQVRFVLIVLFLLALLLLILTKNVIFLKITGILLIIPCIGALWNMVAGEKKK